jgi:hypothetical protein
MLNDAAILTIMSGLHPASSSMEPPALYLLFFTASSYIASENSSVTICELTLYKKVVTILTTRFSILQLCMLPHIVYE